MTHSLEAEASVATRSGTTDERRLDIQALRALAVTMVIVYHFWPNLLPGGFIGVDVFFVISGYLITAHLYRHPPRDLRSLASFWSRRILRLIPAAAAALTGTLLLVLVVLSQAEWAAAAKHVAASMLYVENWLLVRDATDYLRAEANPSPFQHFWSLSVEEQFYLVWPLVIGAGALALGHDRAVRRRGLAALVALFALVSFVYALTLTWSDPPLAYFASPARMWELAVGGVLAIAVADSSELSRSAWNARLRSPGARTALIWVALSILAVSAFAISGSTPFPGWAALAPTSATVMLLFAGDPDGRFTPRRLMHARPVQFLGDVSYAAYLWHWPLVTLIPIAMAAHAGWVPSLAVKLALLPILALVAWLSTRFLEDPLRRVPDNRSLRRRALITLLVSTTLVLGMAAAVTAVVESRSAAVRENIDALISGLDPAPCVGAAAMESGAECDNAPVITTPEFARGDIPSSIRVGECLNWPPFNELVSCSFGEESAPKRRIALFGNSHAGQWQPPLEAIATEQDWQLDTFVIGVCQPSVEPVPHPDAVNGVPPEELTRTCDALVRDSLKRIANDGYDLVIMSTLDHDPAHGRREDNIYGSTIASITASSVPVLVLRDTPASMDQANDTPTCLGINAGDPDACAGSPDDWIRQDPLTSAAERSGSSLVHELDLNRYLCTPDTCPPVIGGVVTYADFNHMSATFARTLAPYLAPAVLEAMEGG